MDVKTVTAGLVALVVAVIVIATVAVPIINDNIAGTPFSGTNSSAIDTYTFQASSPTFTIERSSTGVSLTVGGTTTQTSFSNGVEVYLATDDFSIRTVTTGAQLWNYTDSTYILSNDSSIEFSVVVSNGSYTVTGFGDSALTGTINWALFRDPAGTWGLYNGPIRATLGQNVILGHLYETGNGPYNLVSVTNGEIDGFLIEPYRYSNNVLVSETVAYDIDFSKYGEGQTIGVYSGMTMDWGESDSSDTFRAWAPIAYHSTQTETGGINSTLLAVIPLLLFIVAVMVAVRLIKDA